MPNTPAGHGYRPPSLLPGQYVPLPPHGTHANAAPEKTPVAASHVRAYGLAIVDGDAVMKPGLHVNAHVQPDTYATLPFIGAGGTAHGAHDTG